MKLSGKLKLLFKPNVLKIILTIAILMHSLHFHMGVSLWGHSISPIPKLVYMPYVFFGFFSLLIVIPYSYLLACILVAIFDSIKERKIILVLAVILFVTLIGLDEPIINKTINKPNYSCTVDSDCSVKIISKGGCGINECVNQDWEYYDSVINNVSALCAQVLKTCTCVENRCVSKNLIDSIDLNDCESFEGYMKEECHRIISNNINNAIHFK